MHIDRRLLGWGLFFILVGGIPLAVRANLLDEKLVGQWPQIWPLLLIAWGIGLLLRSTPIEWIGGALTAITFGVMGGGLLATGSSGLPFATGCSSSAPSVGFQSRSGNLEGDASIDLKFTCGSLRVSAGDGSSWSVAGSDRDGRGPKVATSTAGVSIEQDDPGSFPGGGRSSWDVTVPRGPAITLGLKLDAGDGTADLSGASIASASISLNAGKLDLSLGDAAKVGDINATVNAGSAAITLPGGSRSSNLSLNAGSLQVCLPSGSPVRVSWSGALGSNNFTAAGLTKLDESSWSSSGFDATQPHNELHVTANAGSFELRFGGACRA
jgi:hypothetical protein